MKQRFRLYRRNNGGRFYLQDSVTGRQESLGTSDRAEAERILHSRNEAERQPAINLQIARAYLAASDPNVATRTWQFVMNEMVKLKHGSTKLRWETANKDSAYDLIRNVPLLETRPEHFLRVMETGTVSTNMYLRRLQNLALDMSWLPWPVLAKKRWPTVAFRERRGITWEEHQKIIAGESNDELRDFYEFLWHLGGSQTDMASLRAEDIDWPDQTIAYARTKTGSQAMIRFGDSIVQILQRRPRIGYLFPQIARWKESDRAKAFIRRLRLVGVSGVSLHSYRYAWAERARACGLLPP